MQRRDFMASLAALGGTVIPSWILPSTAHAQAPNTLYTGKILVNIRMDGGPCQFAWSDFRNRAGQTPVEVGPFRFRDIANNRAFVTRFAPNMLVVNGVNSETNGHDEGNRAQNTGRLDMGYPAIAELHAWQYGKTLPLAYLNSGSAFAASVGLRAPTPTANNLDALRAMLQPNAQNATTDFFKQGDLDKVFAARAERARALQAAGTSTPRGDFATRQILGSSDSRALLAQVGAFVPATLDANFQTQHVALVAAQAGVASTLQFSLGGFDNHGNLDTAMVGPLNRVNDVVNYIVDKAGTMNIANRLVIRLYGEFGRTFNYNNGNGVDHYAAGGTNVIIEPGVTHNRVVGYTGAQNQAQRINLMGQPDPAAGFTLTPRHVHFALRKYLGINVTDPRFDLKVPTNQQIDIFNPAVSTGMINL